MIGHIDEVSIEDRRAYFVLLRGKENAYGKLILNQIIKCLNQIIRENKPYNFVYYNWIRILNTKFNPNSVYH